MASFDERARDWDTPPRRERAAAVARAIRASVPLSPSTRAIDLGAGTGLLGLELAGEVGEMVLAELSAGMLEVAAGKLAGEHPNVTAVRFDLLADPPPGPPFDLAISLLLLHHLPDTGVGLAAIGRLLRPGGRIALADLDTEDGSYHDDEAEGVYHLGFDRQELAGLARAAGYADVRVETATIFERDGRAFPIFLLLGRRSEV